MRSIALLCLLLAGAATADTNLPVHTVSRLLISRDGVGTVWRDTLSDGTYRDSRTVWPETPIRVALVATNDVGMAWRLDYAAVYTDGSNVTVRTNSNFILKPREARTMPHQIDRPPMPNLSERVMEARTNRPASAFAQVAARSLQRQQEAAMTTQTMKRVVRALDRRLDGDCVISHMSDGTTATNQVRRMTTARVASATPAEPAGNSNALPLAGSAAAVAAAAFAAGRASKRSMGATANQVDPAPGGAGAPTL